MQKLLLTGGAVLLLIGLLWPLILKIGLGRLPGDLVVARSGFRFYFPFSSMVLISFLASLVLRLLRR